MTPRERELQKLLRNDDRVISHSTFPFHGFPFIETEGHGFLAVDKDRFHADLARIIFKKSNHSYEGQIAYYLEEDNDAPEFLKKVKELEAKGETPWPFPKSTTSESTKKIKLTAEDISKYANEDELYLLEAENAKKEIKPKCSRCGKFVNEETWNANGHLCDMCAEDIDMGRDKE